MAAEIAAEALEIEKLGIEEEILKKAEDEIKLLKSQPPADLPDLEDVSCEPGEIEYDYVKKDLEPGNDTLDLITSNEKVLTKLDDTNPEDIVLSPVLSPAPDAGRKRNHFKNEKACEVKSGRPRPFTLAGDRLLLSMTKKGIFEMEKSPDFGEIENIPTVVDEIKKDISELTSVTSTEECVHL